MHKGGAGRRVALQGPPVRRNELGFERGRRPRAGAAAAGAAAAGAARSAAAAAAAAAAARAWGGSRRAASTMNVHPRGRIGTAGAAAAAHPRTHALLASAFCFSEADLVEELGGTARYNMVWSIWYLIWHCNTARRGAVSSASRLAAVACRGLASPPTTTHTPTACWTTCHARDYTNLEPLHGVSIDPGGGRGGVERPAVVGDDAILQMRERREE